MRNQHRLNTRNARIFVCVVERRLPAVILRTLKSFSLSPSSCFTFPPKFLPVSRPWKHARLTWNFNTGCSRMVSIGVATFV